MPRAFPSPAVIVDALPISSGGPLRLLSCGVDIVTFRFVVGRGPERWAERESARAPRDSPGRLAEAVARDRGGHLNGVHDLYAV